MALTVKTAVQARDKYNDGRAGLGGKRSGTGARSLQQEQKQRCP